MKIKNILDDTHPEIKNSGNSGERFKKFTILHSNDLHGDFLAEAKGSAGDLIGGLSVLSGYINQVRHTEKNVIYAIAGDMLQGSMIDAEYKGISTMDIMNYLAPDVVTLGNHELDYGLPHLLFLEKMANFPIVNANLYIKNYHKRLMKPFIILDMDGFRIMFIGIITQDVLKRIKLDSDIATFVGLEDAALEVGIICNAYKNDDIDLTILLTHIGFEADKQLTAMLDPAWGVDMIIGGHSHTSLEQPVEVNGVLITQAGVGSDQIGRFDIVVDDDTNSIVEWQWKLLPVDENLAEPDQNIRRLIDSFQGEVDRKYSTVISNLFQQLTHPARNQETELGNLFADILAQHGRMDIAFLVSGSIRGNQLGPMVTLGNLKEIFPYDSSVYRLKVTGALIKRIFEFNLAYDMRQRGILQVSKGVKVIYKDTPGELESLSLNDEPILDEQVYTIGLLEYSYINSEAGLGIPKNELLKLGEAKVVTTSVQDVIIEFLQQNQHLNSKVEGRVIIK